MRVRFEKTIQVYLLLPFTIPLIGSGIGLMLVFGEAGMLGQLWPVGIACCVINLPFMIWAVTASASTRSIPTSRTAAANCGAPPLQTFLHGDAAGRDARHHHRLAPHVHPGAQRVPGQPAARRRADRDAAGADLQFDPLDHHARPRRDLGRVHRLRGGSRSSLLDRLVGLDIFLKSK